MGIEITRDQFEESDYASFAEKLGSNLDALKRVLARPGFGAGPDSVGTELELNLIDATARPAPVNREVLSGLRDERITVEVDRFNLEINSRPYPLAGKPFSALLAELESTLAHTRAAALGHGARVVPIGILPTLTEQDLDSGMLTDGVRYRALSAGIRRVRGAPFEVRIDAEDSLSLRAHDVTLEGANTSFQVHLRVTPERFAAMYNAAQLATAPVLAASCNSPLFLGRRLWHETRVLLFRQAVDDRAELGTDEWRPARVSFGHGWVRNGASELFAESVALHEPLLPVLSEEDPIAICEHDGVPELAELRLHHGTVWRWNRAVYDAAAGGHLRIEFRALPAGPTLRDMVANAAFLIGLTLELAQDVEWYLERMTFGQVRRNFYEAARLGLGAELLWPSRRSPSPQPLSISSLVTQLLPLAERGLQSANVDATEAETWLNPIRERIAYRQNGAVWQRAIWSALRERLNHVAASQALLERYLELSQSERCVATWPCK